MGKRKVKCIKKVRMNFFKKVHIKFLFKILKAVLRIMAFPQAISHWKEELVKEILFQLAFFILAVEVMFIEVRSNVNVNIAGVKIGGHSVKLSAYADDTYFFTLEINSLRLILNTCDKFEEYSSLKLSVEKCQACWIGSAKGTQDAPANCNWINLVEDKILTLGVHRSYDVTLAEKCNFLNLITSTKEVLRIWGSRGLTLAGRIQILKSTALSKMVYVSTMLHPSKQTLVKL